MVNIKVKKYSIAFNFHQPKVSRVIQLIVSLSISNLYLYSLDNASDSTASSRLFSRRKNFNQQCFARIEAVRDYWDLD